MPSEFKFCLRFIIYLVLLYIVTILIVSIQHDIEISDKVEFWKEREITGENLGPDCHPIIEWNPITQVDDFIYPCKK